MNLIYGTYNPAKFKSMEKMTKGLEINLIELSSLAANLEEAEENGKAPLDNATAKAMTYYNQLKQPVFSCDSGLYFENVDEEDQPGVYIKRVKGQVLTDRGMQKYYGELAKKYGGKLTAYYKNAICLVINENEIYKYDGEDLNSERFYLVEKPHEIFRDGFPLDSLSVEMKSMEYYYDLKEDKSSHLGVINGFRNFFISKLGL